MVIDHICIATKSIDRVVERLSDLFNYKIKTNKITNTKQKVNVQFLQKKDSLDIKVIEPSDSDSPLWPFVKKGGGLHHICFKADNINLACKLLEEKGLRIITAPEPGEAFDNELIAFCYAGFGLNIELIDTDKRRGLIPED